jgi:hypothetical protein
MIKTDEISGRLKEIVKRTVPLLDVVRVETIPYLDSTGDPSYAAKVIIRRRLGPEEMQKMPQVVDQLRTWMASKDDDRFPYVRVITEDEERELQALES